MSEINHIVFKMPDRFKVTKTDATEIDATYHSILKDEDAVLGKLLPPTANNESSNEKKGKFHPFFLLNILYSFSYIFSVAFRQYTKCSGFMQRMRAFYNKTTEKISRNNLR